MVRSHLQMHSLLCLIPSYAGCYFLLSTGLMETGAAEYRHSAILLHGGWMATPYKLLHSWRQHKVDMRRAACGSGAVGESHWILGLTHHHNSPHMVYHQGWWWSNTAPLTLYIFPQHFPPSIANGCFTLVYFVPLHHTLLVIMQFTLQTAKPACVAHKTSALRVTRTAAARPVASAVAAEKVPTNTNTWGCWLGARRASMWCLLLYSELNKQAGSCHA